MKMNDILRNHEFLDIYIPNNYSCRIVMEEYDYSCIKLFMNNFMSNESYAINEKGDIITLSEFEIIIASSADGCFNVYMSDSMFCHCQPIDGFYLIIFESKYREKIDSIISKEKYSKLVDDEILFLKGKHNGDEYIKKYLYFKDIS